MTAERDAYVAAAGARAFALYEGVRTPHRSCGIALAETFGLPSRSYQALRRGGLTGEGPCGAIAAGLLVLGELLGDPSPTAGPTPELRAAAARYRARIAERVSGAVDASCNARTAGLEFTGPERMRSCTALAGVVAEAVAEIAWDAGAAPEIPPAPWE